MENEFIIQVAPLIPLPISRTQVFSYLHSSEIKRGSLVEIPFYKRIVLGVVLGCKRNLFSQASFKMKNINKIMQEEAISENQIQLAENMAGYYFSPLGVILKSMIARTLKGKRKKKKSRYQAVYSPEKEKLAKEILKDEKREAILLGPKDDRNRIILSMFELLSRKNKQSLYLFSEIFPAVSFYEKIKSFFQVSEIALIHGNISCRELYDCQEEIKKGKIKIIVATKIGIFLPFFNLASIIIEESGDLSHKQWDMAPRYNAVQVARMISEINQAKIIYSNSFAWLEMQERSVKSLKTFDLREKINQKMQAKVVSAFSEKRDQSFPISKEIFQIISQNIEKRKKSFLVVNRRGFSNFSFCLNCKSVRRCPNCERALVYFDEKEKFRCLHCSYQTDLLSLCPNCGNFKFSHQGIGIQQVQKKIKRLFPEARILVLETDVLKSKKRNERILEKLKDGNYDILIGMQTALKTESFEKFETVAFLDFEGLRNIPDFNSNEIAYSFLAQAKNHVSFRGAIFVQSAYAQESPLVDFLKGDEKNFLEKELRERRRLKLPPFFRLVKLSFQNKDKNKLDKESRKIFNLLMKLSDDKMEISEPYDPFSPKKRGKYSKNILLKLDSKISIQKLAIYPVIANLGRGWTVDVDPISTL